MLMPMSDLLHLRFTDLHAPALALARWTALLIGWVWLGAQGQRLGWSLASGVLAVALWWGLRLVLAQRMRHEAPALGTLLTLGGFTAAGAGFVAQADGGPASFWMLMALAVLWAAWSVALDASAITSKRCQCPWVGWPPVLAALITWTVLSVPADQALTGLPIGLVLLAASLLASATVTAGPTGSRHLPPSRLASGTLPQTSMGLMMGSLWLGSAWCASAGWSAQTVVGLHLLLMAALPGLVRLDAIPRQLPPLVSRALPLTLVLMGALLLYAGQQPAHGLVGMLLLALAWALPVPTNPIATPMLRWAPLGGPLLLLAVGVWSPSLGPQALALAYGGLSALAGLTLMTVLVRHFAHQVRLDQAGTPRKGDASS